MTKLNDETLMQFADGSLDQLEREQVRGLVANTPSLHARLQVFRATGRRLAVLFDEHVNAPIPWRLRNAVTELGSKPLEASDSSRLAAASFSVAHLPARQLPSGWNATIVAGLAIIAGWHLPGFCAAWRERTG
jgi:anti-sigma factor RsiW